MAKHIGKLNWNMPLHTRQICVTNSGRVYLNLHLVGLQRIQHDFKELGFGPSGLDNQCASIANGHEEVSDQKWVMHKGKQKCGHMLPGYEPLTLSTLCH